MTEDIYRMLRDSGYLASPADRYLWKNATPTFRHHLRQLMLLGLFTAIPMGALFSSLTLLGGWDRLVLFLFYLLTVLLGLALSDLVIGWLVLRKSLEPWWGKTRFLTLLPMIIAALILFLLGQWLQPLISLRPVWAQALLWPALAITAWIAAKSCHLLIISRLYWHGIKPPPRHAYPWLMALVLASVGLYHVNKHFRRSPEISPPQFHAPMLILTLDVPDPWFSQYLTALPSWPRQAVKVESSDITNFWTEWGTGAPAEKHQTSLVVFDIPLFRRALNGRDPLQAFPLKVASVLGLAKPQTGGGRYRKYFWEILDSHGARAYAYSFWHSYPASSQNGGVLSERWTPQQEGPPYQVGLAIGEPPPGFTLPGDHEWQSTLDRERQSWLQLGQRVAAADFDLCVAYFPLSDQLDSLPQDEAPTHQASLLAYRLEQIEALFSGLPADARVGILIASGKNDDGMPIDAVLISNWLDEVAHPLTSHLQFAPTVLHLLGLPPDRMMAESRYKLPLDFPEQRVDYGEPERNQTPNSKTDQHYYEELKSLGYVQ